MQYVHRCFLGQCRSSWSKPCRNDLPAIETNLELKPDDDNQRLAPIRRYLPDDARVKTHILALTVRTLCNVQTNQHHPQCGLRSLCYSLKYATKPEPQTFVKGRHEGDDTVLTYLRFQFISYSSAAAFCLGDATTSCTRGDCPLVLPEWHSGNLRQRLWRTYTQRLPLAAEDEPRPGCTGHIHPDELLMSLLFSKPGTMTRYFVDSKEALDDSELDDKNKGLAKSFITQGKHVPMKPAQLNRRSWDDQNDNPSHECYDLIFSNLLPSDRLFLLNEGQVSQILRRARNGKLRFHRFLWKDLSPQKNTRGISQRCEHFQLRLFNYLPWLAETHTDTSTLVSVLPDQSSLDKLRGSEFFGCGALSSFTSNTAFWSQRKFAAIGCWWIRPEILETKPEPPMERICMKLEEVLLYSNMRHVLIKYLGPVT